MNLPALIVRCARFARERRPPATAARIAACLLVTLASSLGLVGAARAQIPRPVSEAPVQAEATVGMVAVAFSGMNENDVKAAVLALTRELGRKIGYPLGIKLEIFDTVERLRQAILAGEVQLLIIGSWDLATMDVEDRVEIAFTFDINGRSSQRWVTLVRQDRGLRSLADLRGKHVLTLHNTTSHLGLPWMETTLLEQQLGPMARYFGRHETVVKASAAVLPVFFGKVDACIVDESTLEIVATLNPQVGRRLVRVAESDSLANPLICLNRSGWSSPQLRRDVFKRFSDFDAEPAGRQLLTMFKCDRLRPYDPAQLATIKDLLRRHRLFPPPEAAR